MKVKLEIEKRGAFLFQGTYDVADAESFGKACADAWTQCGPEGWLRPQASET